MKKIILLLCLLSAVLSGKEVTVQRLSFDSSPEGKKRYLAQPYTWWGRGQFPVKSDEKGEIITLTNNRTRYVFFIFGKVAKDGTWTPEIGMTKPSKANWATGGFLNFSSGKINRKKCGLKISGAEKGGFTLNFTAPGYQASCRIELKKDDDRLYVLFDTPTNTMVEFTTYPSSYGGSYSKGKALRKRYAVTNTRRIESGNHLPLNKKEKFVFLADSYFDPAQNRGEGPCGIIFDLRKYSGRVSVQNYACLLRFTGKGKMPFILLDFNGVSNAEGEKYMKELPVTFL